MSYAQNINNTKEPFHVYILRRELSHRSQTYRNYSLRRFARFLAVSPATLSGVLGQKRTLSRRKAMHITQKMGLSPKESHQFLTSAVGAENLLEPVNGLGSALDGNKNIEFSSAPLILETAQFEVIAQWYHFAIRELVCRADFDPKNSTKWASLLKISTHEFKTAWQHLVALNLVKLNQDTTPVRWEQSKNIVLSTTDLPSQAIRNRHKQILEKAVVALEETPVNLREFSSSTIIIHTEQIQKFKDAIRDFQKTTFKLVGKSQAPPTDVYELAIQFFPLTHMPHNPVPKSPSKKVTRRKKQ